MERYLYLVHELAKKSFPPRCSCVGLGFSLRLDVSPLPQVIPLTNNLVFETATKSMSTWSLNRRACWRCGGIWTCLHFASANESNPYPLCGVRFGFYAPSARGCRLTL